MTNFLRGPKAFVERVAWLNRRHLDCLVLNVTAVLLFVVASLLLHFVPNLVETLGLITVLPHLVAYGLIFSASIFGLYNILNAVINIRTLGLINTLLSIVVSIVVASPGALIALYLFAISMMTF